MSDSEKWSAHLEYLKVAITLATAILAVAAAVYSDATKIPEGPAKWVLLATAVCVFVTLASSIVAVIKLGNFLIRPPVTPPDPARDIVLGSKITSAAGFSFYSLMATGGLVVFFFFLQGNNSGAATPEKAVTNATAMLQMKGVTNAAAPPQLIRLEVANKKYVITHDVGGGTKYETVIDVATGKVETMNRLP